MDCLRIDGIRAYGYTGYFEAEQNELEQSVNYAEVVQRVTRLIETSRYRTIERLNTQVCAVVLEFEPIARVEATLTKLAAPIPGFSGRISVQMSRSRNG
jgi:dihydroneopterin aldolase